MLKRKDLHLIITVLAIISITTLIIMITTSIKTNQPTTTVKITINGKEYSTYPLNQDQTIQIKNDYGENTIIISQGSVYMKSATCPDQICVKHSPLPQSTTPIICLPHKLVVEIIGIQDNIDIISE
jgi:hypothetical protein